MPAGERRYHYSLIILSLCLAFMVCIVGWEVAQAATASQVSPQSPSGQVPHLVVVADRPVAAGVRYLHLKGSNTTGQPLVAHALEVNIADPTLEVRPVLARDRLGQTETVSSLAKRYGAIGAINGSFFARGNGLALPVGNCILDGKLLIGSNFWRTSVGFTWKRELVYGYLNPKPVVRVGQDGPSLPVENLNRPYRAGVLNLYHRAWGETTATPDGTSEIILLPRGTGYIVAALGSGNSRIPPAGLVLAANSGSLDDLRPGTAIHIDQGLGPYWEATRHLLTGGPLLVEDGQPVFQATQEGFTGTVLARKARTALALRGNGKLLLMVIEGGTNENAGVTLEELAVLMASLGATVAVGMDGGGSSALWAGGKLVSTPSSGQERPVTNALVVLRQIPVFLDGWRLPCDVPPTLVDGRVLVPMRAIFQGLGATVDWHSEAKQITAQKDDRSIRLTVESRTALINNTPVSLEVPAQIVQGRTLVPVRFVSQALGALVEWRAGERAVYIHR